MGRKGYFVYFGRPGGGKSHAAAKAHPRSLALLSAPNNILFYEQWLQTPEGRASGLAMPTRVVVLDKYSLTDSANPGRPYMQLGPDGVPQPLPQKTFLEKLIFDSTRRILGEYAAGRPLSYSNILLDEAGTFWMRIFEEIMAVSVNREGKPDTMKAYNVGANWSRAVIDLLRQVTSVGAANVAVIAHHRDPDVDKEKQGGPLFFSNQVMTQLCADADGVLLREVRDAKPEISLDADPMKVAAAIAAAKEKGSERLWRAHASEHWQSKLRGLPDSEFARIRSMELEDILRLAGFDP